MIFYLPFLLLKILMLFPKACRNSPPRMGWFPAFERYLKQRRCFQESIFHNTEVKAMSQSLVKQPKFCDINTCGTHTGTAFTAKLSQTALSHLFERITSWKKSTSLEPSSIKAQKNPQLLCVHLQMQTFQSNY